MGPVRPGAFFYWQHFIWDDGCRGTDGSGTVFQLSTNGTGFTVIKHFSAIAYYNGVWTNADGKGASGSLVLGGNTLYGTLQIGGINGYGTSVQG